MKFKWFIGIDVSKNTLDLNVHRLSKSIYYEQIANTKKGINSFLGACRKLNIDFKATLFCLEHTGLYNEVLVDVLCDRKMNIWVEQGLKL